MVIMQLEKPSRHAITKGLAVQGNLRRRTFSVRLQLFPRTLRQFQTTAATLSEWCSIEVLGQSHDTHRRL